MWTSARRTRSCTSSATPLPMSWHRPSSACTRRLTFAFGPATENGFYYDVDLGDTKLTDEDLANIEKEMRKIVKENLPIKPFILPRAEAVKLMEERQGELQDRAHG